MDVTYSSVQTCLCPVCGQPNACVMARPDHGTGPCWCTREQFSARLLQQVPEAMRGKACICQACVKASPTTA